MQNLSPNILSALIWAQLISSNQGDLIVCFSTDATSFPSLLSLARAENTGFKFPVIVSAPTFRREWIYIQQQTTLVY